MGVSGSGEIYIWGVEARYTGGHPKDFGGIILDSEWREIAFNESKLCGVPIGPKLNQPFLKLTGHYDFAAAQALRWWFHAQAIASDEFPTGDLCVDTRLVRHTIKYSYEVTREGSQDLVDSEVRRSRPKELGEVGMEPKP